MIRTLAVERQVKAISKSQSNPASIIQRRRNDAMIRQEYASLGFRILLLLIVGWLLFTQVFLLTQAQGNGMFPAVKDGDLILAYRLQETYMKNDVVVYEQNGIRRVGRVLAQGRDVVTMDESGTLRVNGTQQSGEIMYPTYPKEGITYPYEVPEGCVFILGDYRTQTEDSRDYGAIPAENLEGKIITILRRRGL